jgi:hypothetical protein
MRLEMYQDQGGNGGQYQSSVNNTTRGRGNSNHGRAGGFRGRGRGRNFGGGNSNTSKTSTPNNNNSSNSKPRCQICDRPNHSALECWYRFEEDYQPPRKSASSVSAAYGVDTNGMWIVEVLTTSPATWRSSTSMRSMEDVTKFTWQVGQVCLSKILVILCCTPRFVAFI